MKAMKQKPNLHRIGRPPLPDGAAREIVFTLRISATERDAMAEAAKLAGKPVTRWAREVLVERARA